MATPAELLVEAESAYHRLMIGQSAREVVDMDGSRVTFTVANASNLLGYIESLKLQVAGKPRYRGPAGVWF